MAAIREQLEVNDESGKAYMKKSAEDILVSRHHFEDAKKKVIEQPLLEYLNSRKGKLPGITLFEFKAN